MSLAASHEVTNQSTPFADVNLFSGNRALQDALRFHHPAYDRARFDALGAEVGSAAMQSHARLANHHPPALHSHDRYGRRIDEVEFHPSYHALLGAALGHGLHGTPWRSGPGGHIERAAAFMLFTELEPSVLCPVSMSYAVTPALRANAALQADWGARLAATQYDPRSVPGTQKTAVTMGMGMTEKQGGSDVRSNTSRAGFDGNDAWGRRYRVTGHKWFFSAPMSDAFLVLAQTGSGAGAGLSCLFLPRFLPDGSLNAVRIQRLKHKLGNHANASSEVEFEGAAAWLVGEEGRGIPQILEMGALTRLDCAIGVCAAESGARAAASHGAGQGAREACGGPTQRACNAARHRESQRPCGLGLQGGACSVAPLARAASPGCAPRLAFAPLQPQRGPRLLPRRLLGTAGLMRSALSLALHHTAQRRAFGKPLIAQPAMKNVLADLALESEAATALALRLARAVDRTEHAQDTDGHEALMRRVLTPVAKFWVCKRGSHFAQEAMECLGGNGYVEAQGEGTMARIYREMPLNSIWEGAGNIMALDLLRALRSGPVLDALMHEIAPARGAHRLLDRAAAALADRLDGLTHETKARRLARDLALLLQAALLHQHSPAAVFDAFCASRLDGGADVFGLLPAGLDLDGIVARAMPHPPFNDRDTP